MKKIIIFFLLWCLSEAWGLYAQDFAQQVEWCDGRQQALVWQPGTYAYVDMVGDLFHAGHVAFLQKAKEFGKHLIVGIHSDEVCTAYKRKPILTMQERITLVKACRYVDAVLPNAPLFMSDELLDQLHITCVVHGDDFDQQKVEKYFKVPWQRGILQLVRYTPGISTTQLIERVLTSHK